MTTSQDRQPKPTAAKWWQFRCAAWAPLGCAWACVIVLVSGALGLRAEMPAVAGPPAAGYAWLWQLLDHNRDDLLDARDEPFMPAPFRAWLLGHEHDLRKPITPARFAGLAPRMMADIRTGRVQLEFPGEETATVTKREPSDRPLSSRSTQRGASTAGGKLTAATLPPSHREYDRDGDEQLALGEWPRARFAEFAALDQNHDGFVTASELARPPEPPKAPAPVVALDPRQALPVKYRPYDRDSDGQIGLYEWPRDRQAEFADLDANDDGFLAPSELGDPSVATAPAPGATRQAQTLFSDRARNVFRLADRDRDGTLSAQEWQGAGNGASLGVGGAGNLQFPLSLEDFVALYLRANPPGQ